MIIHALVTMLPYAEALVSNKVDPRKQNIKQAMNTFAEGQYDRNCRDS
jgi:hypothetical protein